MEKKDVREVASRPSKIYRRTFIEAKAAFSGDRNSREVGKSNSASNPIIVAYGHHGYPTPLRVAFAPLKGVLHIAHLSESRASWTSFH
jgi:hypothetical protein